MKTTIIIPTRNRPKFVRRILTYLVTVKCPIQVVLADSSDPEQRNETRAVVDAVSKSLQILMIDFPPVINFTEKALCCLEWIVTPYVVFIADDDFTTPEAIGKCGEFLDANPDYGLAHGHSIVFTLPPKELYHGPIQSIDEYPQRSIEQSTGLERIRTHAAVYRTTFYSVHRTSLMKEIWSHALNIDPEFCELIPSFTAVARAKSKKLDLLYMVRQANPSSGSAELIDPLSWFASESFAEAYRRFRTTIEKVIKEETGAPEAETARSVRAAVLPYFAEYLAIKGGMQVAIPHRPPGETTYGLPVRDPRLLMETLVQGTSPFSNSVKPIFDIIATPL